MRKIFKSIGLAMTIALVACSPCFAQVIGIQPQGQALYYWSTTANAFVACPNISNVQPVLSSPNPIALYGLNAGLNQWTPVTSCPGSGSGGGVSQIIAGTNVSVSPVGGTGVVTVNSTGGGG